MNITWILFGLVGILALGLIYLVFVFLLFKRCPPNKILAVYGRIGNKRFVKCYHGGGAIVWPIIQGYSYLDLTPKTFHIPLKGALSAQNIRINVPSTFTVALDISPEAMSNASTRLLGLNSHEIDSIAIEIITGQMRLTVASLTIEQINQDRELFLAAIKNHIDPELHKVGITLINVNITDISDESHYIESIGKKAASLAVNQAKIDVAEADKRGEIGRSLADQEKRISVASYNAKAIKGENEASAEIAQVNAALIEKRAQANMTAEVAEQNAAAQIQIAKVQAEQKRLEAEQIVPWEIERQRIVISAEAEAQKTRLEAEGNAAAILAVKKAEADSLTLALEAKSNGYKKLIESCNGDAQAASTLLMIEKLNQIVELQVEAIRSIKIDKITVWDSGSKDGESSTANFMSSMVKSLPPLHEVAKMAGVDLPEYLGKIESAKELIK